MLTVKLKHASGRSRVEECLSVETEPMPDGSTTLTIRKLGGEEKVVVGGAEWNAAYVQNEHGSTVHDVRPRR